jgi:hypothetical protein
MNSADAEDVWERVKEQRFLMAAKIHRSILQITGSERLSKDYGYCIIISDVQYWMHNEEVIEDWCRTFLSYYERQGMVIILGCDNDLLLFKLRFM